MSQSPSPVTEALNVAVLVLPTVVVVVGVSVENGIVPVRRYLKVGVPDSGVCQLRLHEPSVVLAANVATGGVVTTCVAAVFASLAMVTVQAPSFSGTPAPVLVM